MLGEHNEGAQLGGNVPQEAGVGGEQFDVALVARVEENGRGMVIRCECIVDKVADELSKQNLVFVKTFVLNSPLPSYRIGNV